MSRSRFEPETSLSESNCSTDVTIHSYYYGERIVFNYTDRTIEHKRERPVPVKHHKMLKTLKKKLKTLKKALTQITERGA